MTRPVSFIGRLAGVAAAIALATLSTAACNKASTVTSPSTVTTTTPAAVTETMSGILPVGGSRSYAFALATPGTVTATLVKIGGTDVPASAVITLGIGTPSGTTCAAGATSVQVTGDAGLPTLVSASEQPGLYCVLVADPGSLSGPATFTVLIDHP